MNVGPNTPMPEDGVIQIGFDRYLLPSTVTRQSMVIVDANHQPLPASLSPVVVYDPVARTVTLAPPTTPWLTKGQSYTLILGIPQGDSDSGGVRAIDGATLAEDQTRIIGFFVGEPNGVGIGEPTIDLCRDVLPIFVAKCSAPSCHGSSQAAAASLVLDSSSGIEFTARGRVAQGSNTGALFGTPTPPGRLFGIDMPIIDPGNPGNSWLQYKVEIANEPPNPLPAPRVTCPGAPTTAAPAPYEPLVSTPHAPSEAERTVLDNYVLGQVMPYPTLQPLSSYGDQPLTFEERERIRLWISQLRSGQPLPECGLCQEQ
ncbi:hypothetical protein AKJ09_06048 [Labilithrix luteola]|uniref:Uncharacterized protein n=1 Tax=Labilithrix luteola TaxID=1391654 RepID=A0A0K1Q1Y3_9BACT|nr:hypothetical protein [Labilithrix luteola]AKU99384.1 hypothetical protein AKJ09_06048 [Labilithrix luteola]